MLGFVGSPRVGQDRASELSRSGSSGRFQGRRPSCWSWRDYPWWLRAVSVYCLAHSSHGSEREASILCFPYLGLAQDHLRGSFGAGP